MLAWLVDLVLHLDHHLVELLTRVDFWIYPILFAVIFCETGLVVTPFLPGDSLLFAVGALAAVDTSGTLSAPLLTAVLAAAAILGNVVNYSIGRAIGPPAFSRALPAPQGRVPATHRGVLPPPWRRCDPHLALPADHPHLRALRGRRRPYVLRALPHL